jgi:hypothetical protein
MVGLNGRRPKSCANNNRFKESSIMSIIKPTNLALRFFLEIASLIAVGYWGFYSGQNLLQDILLGIGLPFVMAVIWGMFVSPKARMRLPEIGRLAIELLVFGGGVLALFGMGRPTLATILAVLVLIHLPLTFLLDQRKK